MSLIGYVTLEEANKYVETYYRSTDSLRLSWEMLSDEDKVILLNRSFQTIELLPFPGRKLNSDQNTVFPRWPCKEVPDAVKWAQIENALAKSDTTVDEDSQYYDKLRTLGVESYSIGSLSETLSSGTSQTTGIVSAIAERLLKPLLGGGYRM